ncbi:MAG: septation regulator SpoVG [Clostridia bacterium]|nr:septation regulator SpoVG [Clostridia bacterium]
MNITDIRIRLIDSSEKMKAVASVTFDDIFVVHDIKVIEGKSGLFVAMPSKKVGDDTFKDVAHPLASDFRNLLKDEILAAYENALNE